MCVQNFNVIWLKCLWSMCCRHSFVVVDRFVHKTIGTQSVAMWYFFSIHRCMSFWWIVVVQLLLCPWAVSIIFLMRLTILIIMSLTAFPKWHFECGQCCLLLPIYPCSWVSIGCPQIACCSTNGFLTWIAQHRLGLRYNVNGDVAVNLGC